MVCLGSKKGMHFHRPSWQIIPYPDILLTRTLLRAQEKSSGMWLPVSRAHLRRCGAWSSLRAIPCWCMPGWQGAGHAMPCAPMLCALLGARCHWTGPAHLPQCTQTDTPSYSNIDPLIVDSHSVNRTRLKHQHQTPTLRQWRQMCTSFCTLLGSSSGASRGVSIRFVYATRAN